MRVLLSTIGSRGDVQPLVALALRSIGAEPPGLREVADVRGHIY